MTSRVFGLGWWTTGSGARREGPATSDEEIVGFIELFVALLKGFMYTIEKQVGVACTQRRGWWLNWLELAGLGNTIGCKSFDLLNTIRNVKASESVGREPSPARPALKWWR